MSSSRTGTRGIHLLAIFLVLNLGCGEYSGIVIYPVAIADCEKCVDVYFPNPYTDAYRFRVDKKLAVELETEDIGHVEVVVTDDQVRSEMTWGAVFWYTGEGIAQVRDLRAELGDPGRLVYIEKDGVPLTVTMIGQIAQYASVGGFESEAAVRALLPEAREGVTVRTLSTNEAVERRLRELEIDAERERAERELIERRIDSIVE